MGNKRILYLDALRVFAIFSVIMLHVAGFFYKGNDVNGDVWEISLFWNSISRWGVPVFVMISGALFLQPARTLTIKTVYFKYIKRIFFLIITWSAIYTLYRIKCGEISFKNFVSGMVAGYYHLWFLYMIAALYAITPFLKKIFENRIYLRYFVLLSLVFSIVVPTIGRIYDGIVLMGGKNALSHIIFIFDQFHFHFTMEYAAYYVLGYYLTTISLDKKYRYLIYFLGLLGFVFSFWYSLFVSQHTGTAWTIFDNMFLNVFFESIAVFTFVQYTFKNLDRYAGIICTLSKYSLGIYLIHALLLDIVTRIEGFDVVYDNLFIYLPLLSVVIYLMSLSVTWCMDKIPGVRKIIS